MDHVDLSLTRDVIHIDWHSDLSDKSPHMTLNCGTWLNYVHRPRSLEWYYPSRECLTTEGGGGYCHWDKNPFTAKRPEKICGWELVQKFHGLPTEERTRNVCGVGIAISHHWGGDNHYRDFRDLWKSYRSKEANEFRLDTSIDICDWLPLDKKGRL